jgi:predicted metal-dependent hydrolase
MAFNMAFKPIELVQLITVEDIQITVLRKRIKNLNLRVHLPAGEVRISAPLYMDSAKIESFAIAQLSWIKQQQIRLRDRHETTSLSKNYVDGESHILWGQSYRLSLIETRKSPGLFIENKTLFLQVPIGADRLQKQAIFEGSCGQILAQAIAPLITQWEAKLGVSVNRFTVRKMKTKWGSCTIQTRRIRFNLDLVHKPPICLEYVVVHELVHLLEASHNHRFKSLMDHYMPQWRSHRDALNASPIPASPILDRN